ncbi:MAG TPA: FtsX-like permease family protein [Verrucomicrobiae bacterium]|nr:FtsX-like permease family protein [Verrucomicrobiae bacterium]
MSLFGIVFRSLRQHALSSVVTAISVGLAGGLLLAVWVVKTQAQNEFTGLNAGFDAVLGARGSQLQLVLNSIFHLEASPGNVAWQVFLDIQNNPDVELAVPLAVGDNFHGWRIVGTTPDLFLKNEYSPGKRFELLPGGNWFDPQRRSAVVGSFVAEKMKLKVGDKFHPFHGLVYDEHKQHAETYVVTGVLKPSNTPADRVIWIPLEGVQRMSGHNPDADTEVSAVLVKLKAGSALAGFQLDTFYNKQGTRLTFAWPISRVIGELFNKIGWFDRVLTLVAWLVALVATSSILASIYNSMNERRRELAILRALGARRALVFAVIVVEAATISALGVILSFGFYAVLISVVAQIIRSQIGVVLDPCAFDPVMLWEPAAFIALGALAGIIPAIKAYRTDVAKNLTPLS